MGDDIRFQKMDVLSDPTVEKADTKLAATRWAAKLPISTLSMRLNQERVVLVISVVMFLLFSFMLRGFLEVGNLLSLLQNVAVLGILAIGMGLVVIGRDIDLTMVAVMGIRGRLVVRTFLQRHVALVGPSAGLRTCTVHRSRKRHPYRLCRDPRDFRNVGSCDLCDRARPLCASRSRQCLYSGDIGWLGQIGAGRILDIPVPVIAFAALACVAYVGLRYTKYGRFIYAMGDNPLAARNTGIAMRPMTVLLYGISAVIAFAAGIVMATMVATVNTRFVGTTMVYDIILVVVIGGIGLSGGKGAVRNVIAGTVLIGLLLNGLTIMDISDSVQNNIKSLILLLAIILDSVLDPRDEQTSSRGISEVGSAKESASAAQDGR